MDEQSTGTATEPQNAESPVESVTRIFVVSKRYPLLVEGDFTEVLAKLEPTTVKQAIRFGPVFRLVDRQTGQRESGETGRWAPNLDNISGVQPAVVPVPPVAYAGPLSDDEVPEY